MSAAVKPNTGRVNYPSTRSHTIFSWKSKDDGQISRGQGLFREKHGS
jgi:hypothetical protein